MIVKANHPNVDIDGTVTIPYLIQWNNNCSLTLLVQHLSTHFSQDPPLYTKPTHTPSPPPPIVNNSVYSPQNLSNDNNNQNWYTQTPDPYVASTSSSYTHNNYSNPTYTTPTAHPTHPTATPIVNSSVYPTQNLNPSSSSYGQNSAYTNTAYSQPINTLYNSTGSSNNSNYNNINKNTNTYNTSTSIPTNVTPASASYALNSQFSHLSTSTNYPGLGHNSDPFSGTNTFATKREKLEFNLTNKLQQTLHTKQTNFNKEIQYELTIQKSLNESYITIQNDIKNMNKYKNNISESLTIINNKNHELEVWVDKQQQQEQNTNNANNDIESYIIPYDDISTQLIKLSAEIKVIDDLIYYIIKAKVASTIDLSSFLKEIRRLSSNQFLLRMHMLKINASIAHAITTTGAGGQSGGGSGGGGGGYMNGSSNGGLK